MYLKCSFVHLKAIIVAILVALVAAQQEPVAIVSSNSETNADGSYTYA